MTDLTGNVSASLPEHPAPRQRKLSTFTTVLFILAFGGAFLAVITPSVSTFAVRLSQLTSSPEEASAALGWIFGVGGLIALVAVPVVGTLSDRTTSRLGRRRPWLLGGSVLTLASLVVIGLAPNVTVAAIGWFATQLFSSGVMMALGAFMPDWVPVHQRGRVGGWVGIAQQSIPLLGIFIAQVVISQGLDNVLLFLIPGAGGMLFTIIFAFVMPDRRLTKADILPFNILAVLKTFWFSPRKYPDFAWAWLGRFFMALMFGIYAVYQFYFILARFESDIAAALGLQLAIGVVQVIVLTIAAHFSGLYSDRTGRRKNGVYLGSGLFVVAMVLHAFAFDLTMLWIATVVASLAIGVYFAVDLALVTDVLPDKDTRAGTGMGIFQIANTLPASIAPFLAPPLLAIGGTGDNYVVLWLAAAGVAVLGSLTVSRIRSVR